MLKGFALYLLLCTFSALTGRGILRVFSVKLPDRAEPLFAPVLTYALWVLVLGGTASFGIPVKQTAPWLWAASAVLAIVGMPRTRGGLARCGMAWLSCALFPVIAMNSAFIGGLTESVDGIAMDGWYYLAGGVYAWEPGLRHAGHLNIVQQAAATFPGHRHATFTLLGFLSPLVRAGDTLAVASLLMAWMLFCLGNAVQLACVARGWSYPLGLAVTALTVDGGWVVMPVWGNFFDTALAMVYLPALASAAELWDDGSRCRWVVLGVLLAGLSYTYLPLLPFVTGAAAVIALPQVWRERQRWRTWVAGALLTLLVWAVLSWPELTSSMGALRYAYGARIPMTWLFGKLSEAHSYPGAFWGLGGETCANRVSSLGNGLGWGLTALALAGVVRMIRDRDWGIPLCMLLVIGGSAYSVFVLNYHYPASKFLSLTWWCFPAAVVAGYDATVGWLRSPAWRRYFGPALLGLTWLVTCRLALWHRAPVTPSAYDRFGAAEFRHVRHVREAATDGALMLAVDDWLPNLLAVYHLRDLTFHVATPRTWLCNPFVVESLGHLARVPIERIRYILTDHQCAGWCDLQNCAEMTWSSGPYQLWRVRQAPPGEVSLVGMQPAIGVGKTPRGRWFWLGDEPTALYVFSGEAGTFCVKARFMPGPGRLDPLARTLQVESSAGYHCAVELPLGPGSVSLPVVAGMNRLGLVVVDTSQSPGSKSTGGLGHDSLIVGDAQFSLQRAVANPAP